MDANERYRGPRTLASPKGFVNNRDTIRVIEDGMDLLAIVSRMVRDLKRLFVELGQTPGRWFVGEDNGSYEVGDFPLIVCDMSSVSDVTSS